jgi:hypothetical protein
MWLQGYQIIEMAAIDQTRSGTHLSSSKVNKFLLFTRLFLASLSFGKLHHKVKCMVYRENEEDIPDYNYNTMVGTQCLTFLKCALAVIFMLFLLCPGVGNNKANF